MSEIYQRDYTHFRYTQKSELVSGWYWLLKAVEVAIAVSLDELAQSRS